MIQPAQQKQVIFMVAGESSGDTLGAGLIQAIKARQPDIEIMGVGGPQMIQAGMRSLIDIEKLNVMGFVEPLKRLPELLKIRRFLIQSCLQAKASLFIGIDFQEFNFSLAKALKKKQVTTMQYVSPTIWAWRPKRIKKIIKSVDHLLLIYPFEKALFEQTPVQAHYVGHTLADQIDIDVDSHNLRHEMGLQQEQPVLTVMPGSRKSEIKSLARPFMQAASILNKRISGLKVMVPMIHQQRAELFQECIQDLELEDLDYRIYINKAQDCIAVSDVVLLASGTATLETMLHKKPMVVGYKVGPMTYQFAKRLIKTTHIAMPNILAGKTTVNEFLQHDCEAQLLADDCEKWFKAQSERQELVNTFTKIHHTLKQNANEKAADVVMTRLSA